MKRLLIISLTPPYPLTHGGAIAQYYFLAKLQNRFDITFLMAVRKESEIESLYQLEDTLNKVKIVKYCEENQSTIRNIIIKSLPYRIERKLNLKNLFLNKPLLDKRLKFFIKDHLKRNHYDIIQCEFFETLPILELLPKHVLKVFIHHELRFKALSNSDYNHSNSFIEKIKKSELNFLKKADRIGVFNNDDQRILTQHQINSYVTPFAIPDELIGKTEISKYFNKFVFLGGEGHWPNRDGILWFLQKIYLPNYDHMLPIEIIGAWKRDIKKEFADYKKIIFVGFVDDISNYLNESIMVVPIKSGAGLRTKILLAMANKVPIITTRFGSEGLYDDERQDHFRFFEDNESFVGLLNQNIDYLDVAEKAFNYYMNHYGCKKLIDKRVELYEELTRYEE